MDCCPVMVSDLPVMCSRIDGVVTVVKAEQTNSTCHDFYWGKSHHALHRSDVSTLTRWLTVRVMIKCCLVESNIALFINVRNLQHDSAQGVM